MLHPRRRRLRSLSLTSMIPNMLTVISLSAGLTSVRFALMDQWELAVGAIVLAGILDSLDGRLARALNSTSRFGAELDSLADFVSFGVAPVVLLYRWTLVDLGGVGWIVVLGFSVCGALRLARFNTSSGGPGLWATAFFLGLPIPAAGGVVLLPVVLSFQFGDAAFRWPPLVAGYVLVLAALMVSKVPTMSFKTLRVEREYVLGVLLVVAMAVALVTSYPWLTLAVAALAYLASIPFAAARYAQLARANPASDGKEVAAAGAAAAGEALETEDSPQ